MVYMRCFLIAHGLVHAVIWLAHLFWVRGMADENLPFDPLSSSFRHQHVAHSGETWVVRGGKYPCERTR